MKNAATTTVCTRGSDVRRLHARARQVTSEVLEAQHRETKCKGRGQRFESEIARLTSECFLKEKQDLELIQLTNDAKSQRNTEFITKIKESTEERM